MDVARKHRSHVSAKRLKRLLQLTQEQRDRQCAKLAAQVAVDHHRQKQAPEAK
jgi:hypothetical protein